MLGSLQNNGGPTPTLALLSGSPAIDAGDPTAAPATDQRGLARVVNGIIDIGAFELQAVSPQADPGDPYIIHEGQSLTLSAGDSASPQGLGLSYSWDVNGDGIFGDATGVSPTLTWAQLQALGIQASATPYAVQVQINDGYGGTHLVTSQPVTLTVLPGLHITSFVTPAQGILNTTVDSVTVTFSDPIVATTLTAADLSLTPQWRPEPDHRRRPARDPAGLRHGRLVPDQRSFRPDPGQRAVRPDPRREHGLRRLRPGLWHGLGHLDDGHRQSGQRRGDRRSGRPA